MAKSKSAAKKSAAKKAGKMCAGQDPSVAQARVECAGVAAAALTAPVLAGDNRKLVQAADARAAAPNFVGITKWFNSVPLSIGDLRGRVVLVDFWTYGCYNCVNTLPYVTKLYETYKDKGFVVVGVHTPNFHSSGRLAMCRLP